MSLRIKRLFRITALAFLAPTLATFTRGQAPSGRSTRPDPVQRELQRQAEMQIIEKALSKERPKKAQRYAPLVLEQIKSDFLGIQILDRKLTQATSAPGTLNLKLVATSAAEIRKLTKRLKKNLALPATETIGAPRFGVPADSESLQSSLSVLSKLIDQLVSNPMFEQSRLIDSQLAAQALRDMDEIIELSDETKRLSEKLQKPEKLP